MESKLVLVSVIIPVYNAEKFIERAIYSALAQSNGFEIEIICIDDGSTDQSVNIIKKAQDAYNNIVLFQQVNTGPANARNVGLIQAKGKYVSFLDADDYIDPHAYETLYRRIKFEGADVICHGHKKVKPNGDLIQEMMLTEKTFSDGAKCNSFLWSFIDRFVPSVCAAMYSRDFLINKSILFPSNTHYEDAFFLKSALLSSAKSVVIANAFYNYVQHNSSRSTLWNKTNLFDICHFYTSNFETFSINEQDNVFYEEHAFLNTLQAIENTSCRQLFIEFFAGELFLNTQLIIYGTGSAGTRLASVLSELGIQEIVFCDTYEKVKGKTVQGIPLVPLLDVIQEEKYKNYKIIIGSCYIADIMGNLIKNKVANKIHLPKIGNFFQFMLNKETDNRP